MNSLYLFLLCFLFNSFSLTAQQYKAYQPRQALKQLSYLQKNTVYIQIPSSYAWERLRFQSDSAEIEKYEEQGKVSITPLAHQITVTIYDQHTLVHRLQLKAKQELVYLSDQLTPTLYADCINTLTIRLIDREHITKLNLKSSDDVTIEPLEDHQFSLTPNGDSSLVQFAIFKEGELLEQKSFFVTEPPLPTCKLYFNNQLLNMGNHYQMRSIGLRGNVREALLRVRVFSDPVFKQLCPKDSRYHVTAFTLTVHTPFQGASTSTRKQKIVRFSTANEVSQASIHEVLAWAREHNAIVIQLTINQIQRKNHLGERINVLSTNDNLVYFIPLSK